MKVVFIELKKPVKTATINKFKNDLIGTNIKPVIIPEGSKMLQRNENKPVVITYADFFKEFVENNYMSDRAIEVVEERWKTISKGKPFVIKHGPHYYSIERYERMLRWNETPVKEKCRDHWREHERLERLARREYHIPTTSNEIDLLEKMGVYD